jgi:hypothetical protein
LRQGLAAWTEHRPGIGQSDYLVTLDPDDLEALEQEIEDVIARYSTKQGSESVSLHVLALPRPS